jgi:hypothetical protein
MAPGASVTIMSGATEVDAGAAAAVSTIAAMAIAAFRQVRKAKDVIETV